MVNSNQTTLPDYIDHHLTILSVGLNPSLPSVRLGYYFANPKNRFWKAFKLASLIDDDIVLDASVHKLLLDKYRIGFTDVVKRASRMGYELRAADFRHDAPLLREKIESYKPQLVWFHGKVAFTKFMQYAYCEKHAWDWGLHELDDFEMKIYLTPNPSPANAAYSLDELVAWYENILNV